MSNDQVEAVEAAEDVRYQAVQSRDLDVLHHDLGYVHSSGIAGGERLG